LNDAEGKKIERWLSEGSIFQGEGDRLRSIGTTRAAHTEHKHAQALSVYAQYVGGLDVMASIRSNNVFMADLERAPRFLDGKMLGSSWPGRRRTADNPGSQRVSCSSKLRSGSQARAEDARKGSPGSIVCHDGDYRISVVVKQVYVPGLSI